MSSARCKALLDWYASNARKLPWRETRDPYAVWIAEIMLQQTQVKTVLPRYAAWFKRFPDMDTLAHASLDDVLKAWEGLGYYRRARFIHTAAQQIVTEHQGRFPHAVDDILKLPGVGRSTAGAIASFCFDANTPVLDGNVKRVLKRWHAMPEAADKDLWAWAQQAIDQARNSVLWNQTMMELGATICSASTPDCNRCPVSKYCTSAFDVAKTVRSKKGAKVIDMHWHVALHLHPEKGIWLIRRPSSGIWASLWTPPIIEVDKAPTREPTHVHLLTHRRLHLYSKTSGIEPTGNGQWVSDITKFALPTGIHRLLAIHGISS